MGKTIIEVEEETSISTKKEESNYDTFSSSPKGMNSDEEYLIADKRPEDGSFWINPNPRTREEKLAAYGKLCLIALPWVGIQCIWVAEFGTTTPFLEAMGLSKQLASMIWIAGPLTGFFVAPVIGSLSDKSNFKLGRRRPFMIAGLILLGIASTIFACSKYFGSWGLPVAMAMFVVMDAVINVIQTPLRALIADFAPPQQQATGQLMAVTFQGVGGIVGFFLQKYMCQNPLNVVLLYLVVYTVNVFFIALTSFIVKEKHFPRLEGAKDNICTPFINLFKSVRGLSGKLLTVGLTVFFCWWALFTWWPTSSTWYMTVVKQGCCEDPAIKPGICTPESYALCQEGQQINSMANVYANIVQMVIGLSFAILMNKGILTHVRFLWSIVLAVGAALLIGTHFISATWFAYLVGVGMAIPISGINSFPFAIVGKYNMDSGDMEIGAQFGLLNLFIVVPQIICTLVVSELRDVYGNDGLSWAIVTAGIAFGIAAVLALFIKEYPK